MDNNELIAEAPTPEQFEQQVFAERERQEAKGYTTEHDQEHGIDHLLMWAIEYARRGESVKFAALVVAARELLAAEAVASLEAVKAETTTEWAIARQDGSGALWDVSLLLDDRAEADRERAEWQAEFDADDDPVVVVERTKGVEPGEWRLVSTEGGTK